MIPVLVESPYAGDIEANVAYARRAYRDCLFQRGEAPFASHLNYTQPGVLDDSIESERDLGIEAGLEIGKLMKWSIFYIDLGFSSGMRHGLAAAIEAQRNITFRTFGHRLLHEPADHIYSVNVDLRTANNRFNLDLGRLYGPRKS